MVAGNLRPGNFNEASLRFVGGTLADIQTGTEVALSSHAGINAADRVLAVKFKARQDSAYIGINGVSTTDGYELKAQEDTGWIEFGKYKQNGIEGSVAASDIFVDVDTNDDDVDFLAILA